jgi:CheY-like chemotaxis protein
MNPGKENQPSDVFLEEVKDILEHLYDYPYLQKHVWAQKLIAEGLSPTLAGQQLRRKIIEAIETLNPDRQMFFREPEARIYNLLYFYYIEGLKIQELEDELNISRRQVYRDLQRGQLVIAENLWLNQPKAEKDSHAEQSVSDVSSLDQEVSRLRLKIQSFNLHDSLQNVQKAISPLLKHQQIQLTLPLADKPVMLKSDIQLVEQVFINLLSYLMGRLQSAEIRLSVQETSAEQARVCIQFPHLGLSINNPTISRLLETLGWSLSYQRSGDWQMLYLEINAQVKSILLIDDNDALLELSHRYLSNHDFRVFTASDGKQGWEMIQAVQPDVIIMDVMMPEIDGWELLQRVRSDSKLSSAAIIICSVFNNPQLAYALGANYFLAKPINQEMILNTLKELGYY